MKAVISRIYKQPSKLNLKKKQTIFKEWAKDLNREFTKENLWVTHKHMKKHATSLLIREKQIETTVRNHYPSIRIIQGKPDSTKCRWGCRSPGNLIHCWWECDMTQSLLKTVC